MGKPDNGNQSRERKLDAIRRCLEERTVDLWHLRELALTEGGLINAAMRKKAWHQLVGLRHALLVDWPLEVTGRDDLNHVPQNEVDLIRRDVGRSVMFRYDKNISPGTTRQIDGSERWERQNKLASVILSVVSSPEEKGVRNDDERLHYYQGFHDISAVVLLNLERPSMAAKVLKRVCASHLRDAMKQDFSSLTWLLELLFFPLLQSIDEELHDFLVHAGLEATVILPWLITWFSHDVHSLDTVSRLFDAFLASHPLMPLYLAIAIIVHPVNRKTIFCTECDGAMQHVVIKGLVGELLGEAGETDVQELLDDSVCFMRKVPPRSLLTLAKRYETGKRDAVLRRAGQISLLKAPPSWALSSTSIMDMSSTVMPTTPKRYLRGRMGPRAALVTKQYASTSVPAEEEKYVRAKVASGVTLLMTKDADVVLTHSNNGRDSQQHSLQSSIFGALNRLVTATKQKQLVH